MKPIIPLLPLLFVSSLLAAQSSNSQSTPSQMQNWERSITPDAGPRVAGGADVIITADFIYWTAREDGLGYAYDGTIFGSPVNANVSRKGNVKDIDFEWNPGFKVGLGVGFNHDGWDLYAQYTWFRTHPQKDRRILNLLDVLASPLRPLWDALGNDSLPTQVMLSATGDWALHFNVIDLELGRNYYVSKYLTLHPFAGLKGTWQEQDYEVCYEEFTGGSIIPEFCMKQDLDYWGIGVRVGSNNAWYFIRNFCFFGDFALTALWESVDLERKDTYQPNNTIDAIFLNKHIENDFYTLKGVLEFAIGLRCDLWWRNDDYHFGFQAGWEEQIWFDQNQLFHVTEESAHGDLYLQGLTVKVRFDF